MADKHPTKTEAAAARNRQEGRRWRPYPAYKDSGVEWLGKIPAHWHLCRIKYASEEIKLKLAEKPDSLPYIGLENVESKSGKLNIESSVEEVDSIVGRFERGDVLFGKLRPYLTKVLLAPFEGVCTTEFMVLRATRILNPEYLFYQLISEDFIKLVDSMTYGAKMPRINSLQINNLSVCVPPKGEQILIITFLDNQLAKIDGLIAKKERQIALLQEKRTALISRAVTKGLDPTVPMKDSGVEWLGEIPAHWEVKRIKNGFEVRLGKMLQSEPITENDTLEPYLRAANIYWEGVDILDHCCPVDDT